MEKGRRIQVRKRYGEPGIERLFTPVNEREQQQYFDQAPSRTEYMVIATARETPDGAFLFVGTGLPMAGCMMAQHTYAPNSVVVMESGVVGPNIRHLPISVADARVSFHCTMTGSMSEVFGSVASRGYCTAGILGGAECDRYGNINSMFVGGDEERPRVRLAGSGGANPIASLADFVIVMMLHERRRFPERCSHLTSPAGARGRPGSGEERWRFGLYRGGSTVVITNLGILRTDMNGTGELLLDAIYPAVDEAEVYENTGWALRRSPDFHVMDPPTCAELKILRCLVDPTQIYLRRRSKTSAACVEP